MGTRIQKVQTIGGGQANLFPNPIIAQRAPTSSDIDYPLGQEWINTAVTPATVYTFVDSANGTWDSGGNALATTTAAGIVTITDNSYPIATKTYVDNIAIAGAPVATTTTAGIGELATDAEAIAGTPSTGTLALFVTPSNLAAVLASPTPIGGTVAAAGTFTDLTADGTGQVSLGSNAAGDFTVSSGDLSLLATTNSVVINGAEAVDDAIQLTSAAGGLAVSVAKSAVIATTESNADSLQLTSAGGCDLTATGASGKDIDIVCTSGSINLNAGETASDSMVLTNKGMQVNTTGAAGRDITLTNTGGSINLVATENAAQNIYLHANGGTSETVQLHADQGTGDTSVYCLSDVGGVTLSGGKAAATAVNLTASDTAGGITMTAGTGGILPTTTGPVTIVSTYNNAGNMYLHANGGTSEVIKIHADQGTATTSLNLVSDVGGITLNAGKTAATAINLTASGAGGGMTLTSGTGGVTLTNTGALSLAGSGASNITIATGDLSIIDTASSVIINGGEAVADAIQLTTANVAGGITATTGTGGFTLTNTGALSLAGSGASNITIATGDLSLIDTASSIVITAGEGAVDAIQLNANTAGGGIDINASSGGVTVDTTAAISLDSATASNFTVTGAADLTLSSSAGAVNVTSGEANSDSINVTSAGGMNVVATGGAGKDTIITNTSGSITITAGESASDAFNLTASGAASRMTLTAGTAGISLQSGVIVKVTSVAAAVTPYALLGTDYFVTTDTTGGVLTITLPASPTTGRMIVIYDGVGQAAANNVTIDGNGKSIAFAGSSAGTKVLNTAYESATLVYNGTLWCAQDVV
jgi:hypothetical protein